MHLPSRLRHGLAAVAITGLLLAACGDEDDDGNGNDTTPDTTPTTETETPTEPAAESPTPSPTGESPSTPDDGVEQDESAIEVAAAYFRALDAGDFEAAYALWADDGAASGMSLAEFEQAHAGLAGASALFETADAGAGTTTIAGSLLRVNESEGGAQSATETSVEVALQHDGEGWVISSLETSNQIAITEPPDGVAAPEAVIATFYDAVNAGNIVAAYTFWDRTGEAAPESFEGFAAGYQDTASVTVETGEPETEGAAGTMHATVPVALAAVDDAGGEQVFCGAYTLSQANVEPFNAFGWRIDGGDIAAVEGATSADLADLVANGCELT